MDDITRIVNAELLEEIGDDPDRLISVALAMEIINPRLLHAIRLLGGEATLIAMRTLTNSLALRLKKP